jgi:hypothetical protein
MRAVVMPLQIELAAQEQILFHGRPAGDRHLVRACRRVERAQERVVFGGFRTKRDAVRRHHRHGGPIAGH